jgi:hypothetical protein
VLTCQRTTEPRDAERDRASGARDPRGVHDRADVPHATHAYLCSSHGSP